VRHHAWHRAEQLIDIRYVLRRDTWERLSNFFFFSLLFLCIWIYLFVFEFLFGWKFRMPQKEDMNTAGASTKVRSASQVQRKDGTNSGVQQLQSS